MSNRLRTVIVALIAVVALGAGLLVALPLGRTGLLGVVGLLGGIGLLAVPKRHLPSIALVCLIMVPRQLYAETILNNFSVPLVIMIIWRIRLLVDEPRRRRQSTVFVVVLLLVLGAWMFWVSFLAGTAPFRFTYALAFVLTLGIVLSSRASSDQVARVLTTWQVLAVVLAAYSLVEFVLQRNLVFDPLIALAGSEPVQHWSVYRSYASLGHPLYAGLFFSIAFAISVGRKLEGGGNGQLVYAGVSLAGVLLTVSRNSLGAAAAAAAIIIVASMFSSRSKVPAIVRVGLGLLVVAGVALAFQSSVFQERVDSAEADSSTAARDVLLDLTLRTAAAHGWLGAGAASAADAAAPFNAGEVYIEGAWYQILISLGVPGVVLFLALFLGSIGFALRKGRFAAAGAMVAYAFSISFTPVLESHRPYLLLLGFILWACWAPPNIGNVSEVEEERRAPQVRSKLGSVR